MNPAPLLATASGLTAPWQMTEVLFSPEEKRLDIHLDFPQGSGFLCPLCGNNVKTYDSRQDTWRHLNFFQHAAYMRARVPRVNFPSCGIRKISVPWARPNSRFTLMFEAYVMVQAKEIPMSAIATLTREHDTRIWRIVDHYVATARKKVDMSTVTQVGIEVRQHGKEEKQIVLFFDLDKQYLLFVAEGDAGAAVSSFVHDLIAHRGKPREIVNVTTKLSPELIKEISKHLPYARITFDRSLVSAMIDTAVDQVWRNEMFTQKFLEETLIKTGWIGLKDARHISEKQRGFLIDLRTRKQTAEAYRLRFKFQNFFKQPDLQSGDIILKEWVASAFESQLEPMINLAETLRAHREGMLTWFSGHLSNTPLDDVSELIDTAENGQGVTGR